MNTKENVCHRGLIFLKTDNAVDFVTILPVQNLLMFILNYDIKCHQDCSSLFQAYSKHTSIQTGRELCIYIDIKGSGPLFYRSYVFI